MTNELPYQRSDEFDQELYLRPIDDDGRRFLRLMFQAANGTVEGCKGGIVQRTRFWLMAEQTVLADLLGISREIKQDSRTKRVRRIVEGLEELGILRRATMVDKAEDGKPVERLYYVLCLMRLMDLPQIDLNTVEGRVVAHLLHNDPFADPDDDFSTDKDHVSGALSGGLSGRLSGGLSGLHGHVHENEHENKTHGHGHDHGDLEKCVFESHKPGGQVKFKNIQSGHVSRIVSHRDQALFEKFFDDLVERGWAKACEADRIRLAATFHYVARQNSGTPGKLVTWAWKNRGTLKADKKSPVVPLIASDEQFARELLRSRSTPPPAVNPLRSAELSGVEDLDSEEIQRQQAARIRNLQAIQAMQRTAHV